MPTFTITQQAVIDGDHIDDDAARNIADRHAKIWISTSADAVSTEVTPGALDEAPIPVPHSDVEYLIEVYEEDARSIRKTMQRDDPEDEQRAVWHEEQATRLRNELENRST